MPKKVVVLGSGISSLSAGSFLAKEGYDVTLLEKNDSIGGRARKFEKDGFVFDMGPSWYWMPDVFERFYQQFGKTTADFYDLKRLDPSYRIFWQDGEHTDIPAEMSKLEDWFEELEAGSSKHLKTFLAEAKYKYEVGMQDLVHKPSLKLTEFADMRIMKGLVNMHLLKSFTKYTQKYFKHPKILSLLEFPVLFLGAMPKDTPALYSLMNYADLSLGTWYPMGGMHKIIEAFSTIAKKQGVKIETNQEVIGFSHAGKKITAAHTNSEKFDADLFVSGADYHHTDRLLLKENANYSEEYWDKRSMAPSSLIFYVGVNRRLKNLKHHNLFFDTEFEKHAKEIYTDPKWPSSPLFYTCVPSITDPSVAPEGHENLFFLIPIAPNLKDSEEKREQYFELLLERLEKRTGENIKENIVYKRSYCLDDFKNDYHAFKGNAYGLANTLRQTAFLKPKLVNKKLSNMFYTGQLTVPGPGVPPSIISGEVVAKHIAKEFNK
ncbi:phytoene desaturase family protein [Crocinitomicaceae bacterium]|jgi:phytoene desaturase|nr:phytoene desaturase family protein [Crocinitomicaceae bacterium]